MALGGPSVWHAWSRALWLACVCEFGVHEEPPAFLISFAFTTHSLTVGRHNRPDSAMQPNSDVSDSLQKDCTLSRFTCFTLTLLLQKVKSCLHLFSFFNYSFKLRPVKIQNGPEITVTPPICHVDLNVGYTLRSVYSVPLHTARTYRWQCRHIPPAISSVPRHKACTYIQSEYYN